MYRDEGEAARLRINTLEAKLTEREAGIEARDAEIAELQMQVTRLQGHAPRSAWPRIAPLLAGLGMGALGFAAGTVLNKPSRGLDASPGQIGVPACDLYFERVERCASRVSPSTADTLRSAIGQSREAMRRATETREGRDALRTACDAALEAVSKNPQCQP